MKLTTALFFAALTLAAGAASTRRAVAQGGFPRLSVWSFPGGFCDGCPDTIVKRPRTITVRFLRNRAAEARPDFGGYRIYRAIQNPDTSRMVLIRRYSTNTADNVSWYFSRVDRNDPTFPLVRDSAGVMVAAHDSIITFVDPDSNGHYEKVCRHVDHLGRCLDRRDSIMVLVAPPGPHDGIATFYSITYEARNATQDASYSDMDVQGPDTLDNYARCGTYGDPGSCPMTNLNNKSLNITPAPGEASLEPTRGPTPNLEIVGVVPNPYRGSEVWDRPGQNEIHFINLPTEARITIYTLSGDRVIEIQHRDPTRDFERWDLRNESGNAVASGIYVYRVESGTFSFQNRLVLIR